MMLKTIRNCSVAMMLIAGLPSATVVSAQTTEELTERQFEDGFDEALNQFGYMAGATYQCTNEGDRAALLRRIQTVFNRLTQLFGSDRAFFFAASFGAGTIDEIDEAECDAFKAGFYEALNARNFADGEG